MDSIAQGHSLFTLKEGPTLIQLYGAPRAEYPPVRNHSWSISNGIYRIEIIIKEVVFTALLKLCKIQPKRQKSPFIKAQFFNAIFPSHLSLFLLSLCSLILQWQKTPQSQRLKRWNTSSMSRITTWVSGTATCHWSIRLSHRQFPSALTAFHHRVAARRSILALEKLSMPSLRAPGPDGTNTSSKFMRGQAMKIILLCVGY